MLKKSLGTLFAILTSNYVLNSIHLANAQGNDSKAAFNQCVQLGLDEPSKALPFCDEAIRIDSRNWKYYQYRAHIKLKLNNYTGAIEDATQSINLGSNDSSIDYNKLDFIVSYSIRSEAYYLSGQSTKTIEDTNLMDSPPLNACFYPGNPCRGFAAKVHMVYVPRGKALYRLGRYQESLADFNSAIDLDIEVSYNEIGIKPFILYPSIYICRSIVRAKLGDMIGAEEDYRRGQLLYKTRVQFRSPDDPPTASCDFSTPTTARRFKRENIVTTNQASSSTQSLTSDSAIKLIQKYYEYVSNKNYRDVQSMVSSPITSKNEEFFNRFQKVTVSNLRTQSQDNQVIRLVGTVTYFYRNGNIQREERTFSVKLVNNRPVIVDTAFVRNLRK